MAEKPEDISEPPSPPGSWLWLQRPVGVVDKPPKITPDGSTDGTSFRDPDADDSSSTTSSQTINSDPHPTNPTSRPNRGNEDQSEIHRILNVLDFEDHARDFDRDQFFENFRRHLRELDLLDGDLFDLDDDVHPEPQAPLFPVGESKYSECDICIELKNLTLRPCCSLPVCAECLSCYVNTQVSQAIVKIECLSNACDHYIHREEIVAILTPENKDKFYRFLVDANKEPHVKTCPRCSHISSVDPDAVKSFKHLKHGLKVQCPACELDWCFPCQSPWHEGITCRDFQRGDKLLNTWAKEHHYGQANAQKCPKCRIFIQRSSGCDHMTCTKCKTDFCYRCGERFIEIRFIGDHYSKLSIFGCKYRFKPDQPAQRRLIRGAIFGSKLVAAPIVAGLAVGAGAVLLGFGALALPFYGSYKLHRRITQKKRAKRHKEEIAEWRREMMRRAPAGDPYLENWVHMQELGLDMSRMYPPRPPTGPRGIGCDFETMGHLPDELRDSHLFEDLDFDTWDSESEPEQVEVTQVKVITERYEKLFHEMEGLERGKEKSLDQEQSLKKEQAKFVCDENDDDDDYDGDCENDDVSTPRGRKRFATLATPEQLSMWSEGTSNISADDFADDISSATEDNPAASVATGDASDAQDEDEVAPEADIWKSASTNDIVREIKVTKEPDGERTVCIYHL